MKVILECTSYLSKYRYQAFCIKFPHITTVQLMLTKNLRFKS
jgi:hypothetical protein